MYNKEEVVHDSRKFECIVFDTVKDANKFMEKNDFGVLFILKNKIYVANNKDKGVKIDS